MKDKKTIGIIGGMGPLATADLFQKIIALTDAKKDQDHAHVLIDCNTNIPDRTAAILNDGMDPTREMISSARLLEKSGADLLIMPCNTAHFFYDIIQSSVGIPVISIIEETAKSVENKGFHKALILATDGTIQSKVYEKVLAKHGIESIYPDEETQKAVMQLIYHGIKAGVTDPEDPNLDPAKKEKLLHAIDLVNACIYQNCTKPGSDCIPLLACTELPLARDMYHLHGSFIDPTEVLARAAIKAAGYQSV